MKKMKINRASDLSSISVFPPCARRYNAAATEPQASQLRSQHSQQSFSQGPSSQRGSFSQLTQNSLEEVMATDQRFSSQERAISLRKVNCLPPINHQREESQMQLSKSSSNIMRKWSSSSIPDKCQVGEELEQRIAMMENSLSRFGMILDSIQSDVMQVNKGTKEISLETEHIRQKLILHDTSLQLLNKEQADAKFSLEGSIKSISDQLSKDPYKDQLHKIFVMISTIPEQIEASLQKLQNELGNTFSREIQAMGSPKIPEPKVQMANVLPAKATASLKMPKQRGPMHAFSAGKNNAFYTTTNTLTRPQQLRNPANTLVSAAKPVQSPKVEVGRWKSVKSIERSTYKNRAANKKVKWEEVPSIEEGRECRVIIDSDEEIDGGFSCLLSDNTKGVTNNFKWEAEKETERILRRARRTKRKYDNPIIIN